MEIWVQAGKEILHKWEERSRRLRPRMEIAAEGLVLGAGTVLAGTETAGRGATEVALPDVGRIAALLTSGRLVAYVLAKIERARELWNEGEKALAHIHLAYAGLPLCDEEKSLRLFVADELRESGVTPDTLMKAQGFDPAPLALLKYNPDQPRVPAGKVSIPGLPDDIKGTDVTGPGARMPNYSSDLTRDEFESLLTEQGWTKEPIPDENITNFFKDGAKYSVRDDAKSTDGPTADFFHPLGKKARNERGPDMKLRLKAE